MQSVQREAGRATVGVSAREFGLFLGLLAAACAGTVLALAAQLSGTAG